MMKISNKLKILYSIIGLVILIAIVLFIVFAHKIKTDMENIEETSLSKQEEQRIKKYSTMQRDMLLNVDEHIWDITKDHRNDVVVLLNDEREYWEHLSISNTFKEKYETKRVFDNSNVKFMMFQDGLGDEIYYVFYDEDEIEADAHRKHGDIVTLIATEDGNTYKYKVKTIVNNNLLDDIEIIDKRMLYDKDYNIADESKIKFRKDNYIQNFERILFPSIAKEQIKKEGYEEKSLFASFYKRESYALSDDFINTYGYDKDVIEHNTQIDVKKIKYYKEKSDYNKHKLFFGLFIENENINSDYECSFNLDSEGFLNDFVIVNVINNNIKVDAINTYQVINKISVKGSNWEGCPLSEKFLSNYNSIDSIFPNYDIVSNQTVRMDKNKYKPVKDKVFRKFFDKEGKEILCLYKWIWNEKNEIDDILTYIIPEDKMNLTYEEMYNLAFND